VRRLADRLAGRPALAWRREVGEAAVIAQANARRHGAGQGEPSTRETRRDPRTAAVAARSVIRTTFRGAPAHSRSGLGGVNDEHRRTRHGEQMHAHDQQDDLTDSNHTERVSRVSPGRQRIVR
jgi:hypothetical protein